MKVFLRRVPVVAQWLMNPTRNHEVAGSIPGLAAKAKNIFHMQNWEASSLLLTMVLQQFHEVIHMQHLMLCRDSTNVQILPSLLRFPNPSAHSQQFLALDLGSHV